MHLENRISFRWELYRICGQYATMIDSERAPQKNCRIAAACQYAAEMGAGNGPADRRF